MLQAKLLTARLSGTTAHAITLDPYFHKKTRKGVKHHEQRNK